MKNKIIHIILITGIFIVGVFLIPQKSYAKINDIFQFSNQVKLFIQRVNIAQAMSGVSSTDTSSNYIGTLPHFTLGGFINAGITGYTISDIANGTALANAEEIDIPAPSFSGGAQFRIGGLNIGKFKLPYDIGFSFSYFTTETGLVNPDFFKFNSLLTSLEIRLPIFEEQRLIPGLSASFKYSYNGATLTLPVSVFPANGIRANFPFKIPDTKLEVISSAHALSLKFQTQKKLIFIEPYFGLEPMLIMSVSKIGFYGTDILVDPEFKQQFIKYKKYLEDNITQPLIPGEFEITNNGVILNLNNITGGLRIFGGMALYFNNFYALDFTFSYEPFSNSSMVGLNMRYEF